MISIEKCRELMPDSEKFSDTKIDKIRTILYGIAELAPDDYFEETENGTRK